MKALFVNRQRNWSIVLIILVATLFTLTIAQAQTGGTTRGIASLAPAAPAVAPVPGGPGYVSLNGLDFKPFTPTNTSYSYVGMSIKNTGPASDWFMAPVRLPHGSTIKKFVVYYTDADAAVGMDLEADLLYAPLGNTFGNIQAHFVSTGSLSGQLISAITTITNPVVDLSANTYVVQVNLPNSANVSLVGIRIDYGYQVALPAVTK